MTKLKTIYQWRSRKDEKRFSYSDNYGSPRYHKYATFKNGVLVIFYSFYTEKPVPASYEREVKRVLDRHFNSTGMGICVSNSQMVSKTEKHFSRIEYYARLNHFPPVEEMKEAENLILETANVFASEAPLDA